MGDTTTAAPVVDARTSLALWLRAGRTQRKLSLDDVARITKIQARILDKLESGQADGLPAEVFVKGFVRSFAKCVGLDEVEAVTRYGACAGVPSAPRVRALIETMVPTAIAAEPAAATETETVAGSATETATVPAAESGTDLASAMAAIAVAAATEPRKRRKKARGRKRKSTGDQKSAIEANAAEPIVEAAGEAEIAAEVVAAEPVVAQAEQPAADVVVEPAPRISSTIEVAAEVAQEIVAEAAQDASAVHDVIADGSTRVDTTPHQIWRPTMPTVTSTPPWRRRNFTTTVAASASIPTLVIDDADPESAEREQEDRNAREPKLSFLPPILLDREDRSARQGGLTLAVIILLIAATLTLSYLMRRPSVHGDGVTLRETPTQSSATLA